MCLLVLLLCLLSTRSRPSVCLFIHLLFDLHFRYCLCSPYWCEHKQQSMYANGPLYFMSTLHIVTFYDMRSDVSRRVFVAGQDLKAACVLHANWPRPTRPFDVFAEWWSSSDTLEASWSHFVLVFTRCTNLQHLAVNLRDMFDFLLIFSSFNRAICLSSVPADALLFPAATGGRKPVGNQSC